MNKFITLTLLASFLMGMAQAEDACESKFEKSINDLVEVAEQSSSVCLGTRMHEMQERIEVHERIAKNRLEVIKDRLEYIKPLKTKAILYATGRTFAATAAMALTLELAIAASPAVVPITVGGVRGYVYLRYAATSLEVVANGITIGAATTSGLATSILAFVNWKDYFDEVNKTTNVSVKNHISSFDKDVMAFQDAQTKINDVREDFQKKTKEGGMLSWDDVKYLNFQLQADEAKKMLYEIELAYYQAAKTSLRDLCKKL